MKKITTLFILSLLPLSANMNKALKVSYSLINSTSDEIVYDTDGSKLSHLYWRLDNVGLIGISGTIVSSDRVAINGSYHMNIGTETSTMDDYDWIDGYTASSAGYTHWSHHEDTDVTEVSRFDINAQVAIIETNIGIVYGLLGYKKDTFKWEAKGGFYEYSSNNFQRLYINDDTNVISYNQYINAPYIGLGLVNDNIKGLKFDFNIKYSNSVTIKGEDTHHLRTDYGANGIFFEDTCEDGTLLDYTFGVAYNVLDNISIYASYNYSETDIAKGYTTATYLDTSYYSVSSDGTAGAAYESEMYSFGVRVDF